jgi:hypothetical protein
MMGWPDNWNKPFRQWLEETGLLNCPVTDKERSLYSLRHYYATQRLLEGIPIHDLAQQMGTSVLMISKHSMRGFNPFKDRSPCPLKGGCFGGEKKLASSPLPLLEIFGNY